MSRPFTSIMYPIAIDASQGRLQEETDYSAHVVELIKQVLFTTPGERVNRPDLGCGVKRMVFAPNSEVVASLAQVTLIDSLQRWLAPVITVNTVTVKAIDEVLQILVVYTLKARQQRLYLNLEVTL
jgi:phage baseplate assembly protein W